MSRNNDTFQVLATKGNQALPALNAKVTSLLPGQIGVFDYGTNLAVTAASKVKDFYLAVGLDTDLDGVTDDVAKSSGSHIQKENMKFFSFRPHTPGQPMKVVLSDYTAECETEYGVKLEFRNQDIYRTQGYNQFTKLYTMVTSCCSGCTPTCPSGDANEITRQLIIQITNDPNGLITAQALARQALTIVTHGVSVDIAKGGVVSIANLEAIMTFNASQTDSANFVYTDLEITTVGQKIRNFSSVNLNYFYPRETVIIASKVEGFKCNGKLDITQEAVFEEGSGYDLKQLEYIAKGWKESPYRLSSLNGVADEKSYNVDASVKYDQLDLTYDQSSIGGWEYFKSFLATIVAIPATDTVTRNALTTLLDAIFANLGFDALADDAALANVSPTVIERTTTKTAATDGIA